jgi:hypothetical protein
MDWCKIADALIELGWPRDLRLPQFRADDRQHGQNSKSGLCTDWRRLASSRELQCIVYDPG